MSLTRQEETNVNGAVVKKPSWTVVVESSFAGSGEGKTEDEGKGGCGNWLEAGPALPEELQPLLAAIAFARAVLFSVDGMAEQDNEMNGKATLQNTAEIVEEVSWRLTRK